MQANISMDALLDLIKQFSTDNKKWLADRLYEQVAEEIDDENLLQSPAYREALDDMRQGRITTYKNTEELFSKFNV